jgi:hypothetical protein
MSRGKTAKKYFEFFGIFCVVLKKRDSSASPFGIAPLDAARDRQGRRATAKQPPA